MIDKMEERRQWKNVNTDEGRQKYRSLNNQLRRATDKAREKSGRADKAKEEETQHAS